MTAAHTLAMIHGVAWPLLSYLLWRLRDKRHGIAARMRRTIRADYKALTRGIR